MLPAIPRILAVSFFSLVGLAACSSMPQKVEGESIPTGQLPRDVMPLSYDIHLVINPSADGFSGEESIDIQLTRPRDVIWLHGQDFEISRAELETADGRVVDMDYQQVHPSGVVKLSLDETVDPQIATLHLEFSAAYPEGLEGPYKVTDAGRDYVFTQFQAIAARRAFPSFDEPYFKTPFELSLSIPPGQEAVANTPLVKASKTGGNMKLLEFERSKPLPTYLVAFAVGPLDIVEGPTLPANEVRDRPVPLRGVATRGKGGMLEYALENTRQILEYQERYFGIPYPYAKLDIIAVPDFAAGAMENAGAITYREILLLIDPETSPKSIKRRYAQVHAHELAHMWFGDLVTPEWWNDIWLNESFASWLETKTTADVFPEYNSEINRAGVYRRAMTADSLTTARQIRNPIQDTGDIQNAFDGITYAKGEAVLTMFERYVGEEGWRTGAQIHMDRHRFDVADIDDFMASMEEGSGMEIEPAMRSFLFQPGLPMVNAQLECDENQPRLRLEQSRYLPLGSSGSRHAQTWRIPVCVEFESDGGTQRQCQLMSSRMEEMPLVTASCPDWVHPNHNGLGYYQWSLPEDGYSALKDASGLSIPARLSTVFSIRSAFYAGELDTAETLRQLEPLARSESTDIAASPMSLVSLARERLLPEKQHEQVAEYARSLYAHLDLAGDFRGSAPEDADQREFRARVARFLIETGEDRQLQKIAAQAGARLLGLESGKLDTSAVPGEYVSVALFSAVREYGERFFARALQLFDSTKNPYIRSRLLYAMAATQDSERADWLLNQVLVGERFRKNEATSIIGAQLEGEREESTWQWIRANWPRIEEAFPPDTFGGTPFVSLTSGFCGEEKAREVETFFAPKVTSLAGGEGNLAKALEQIRLCSALVKEQGPSAEEFFRTN